jgi:hypothetical protein
VSTDATVQELVVNAFLYTVLPLAALGALIVYLVMRRKQKPPTR